MTDNEIMKALKRCILPGTLCTVLEADALDLINRQKAEIGQWKEEANKYQTLWCQAVADFETAKSEARKDFATFLKNLINRDLYHSGRIIVKRLISF